MHISRAAHGAGYRRLPAFRPILQPGPSRFVWRSRARHSRSTQKSRGHFASRFVSSFWVLVLLMCAAPVVCSAAGDLAILNQNATFNYANEANYLYLQAQGGALKNIRVATLEFKTEDGRYLPTDTVEAVGTPADMPPNSIQKVAFRFKAERINRAGTYSGTVTVVGETEVPAGQESGNPITKTWNFKYERNAVEFKAGDGSLKFGLIRRYPWSAAHADIPIAFRVTSDVQPTVLPVIVPGTLVSTDGNPAAGIQGISLSGTLTDRGDAAKPKAIVNSKAQSDASGTLS